MPQESSVIESRVSTLTQVERLFEHLQSQSARGPEEAYDQWKAYINANRAAIEEWYAEDGRPTVFAFEGTGGFKIAVYRYGGHAAEVEDTAAEFKTYQLDAFGQPPRRLVTLSKYYKPIDWSTVKGVIVHCHGVAENARFDLLATKVFADMEDYATCSRLYNEQECEEMMDRVNQDLAKHGKSTYTNSWIERFVSAGYLVFAMDLQGHGLSEAWRGSRCNVPDFEYLVRDTIALTVACYRAGEIHPEKPLFLSGVSMGGCIIGRSLELGFGEGHFRSKQDAVDPNKPLINGACFWCPALSADRLRSKFPNNIYVKVSKFLSDYFPFAKLAKLEPNVKFPYITHLVRNDPLVYTEPVPTRIGHGVLNEMDKIIPEAYKIPKDLPVVVIQSSHDTMVDPEGSQNFIKAIPSEDKHAEFFDFGWHYLSREPGYIKIVNLGIAWFEKHLQ